MNYQELKPNEFEKLMTETIEELGNNYTRKIIASTLEDDCDLPDGYVYEELKNDYMTIHTQTTYTPCELNVVMVESLIIKDHQAYYTTQYIELD